jgi:anti-sigma B factor antagonist
MMKLTNYEKGGVVIVNVNGRLTLGDGTSSLRSNVRMLIDGGFRQILLNMAGVDYIDSSGLGELVAAYTTAAAAAGEMKLLNLAKRTHDLLKITKLYTVFEIFEDEASAIASFQKTKPNLQPRNRRAPGVGEVA